ncbi:MAG: hypothetical protein HRT88_09730 [Lentisphaeraceae bacterium]|nr:hypothetical protein [Lentisphaeraceae bacterium]
MSDADINKEEADKSVDQSAKSGSSRIEKSALNEAAKQPVDSAIVDPLTLRASDTAKLKRIKPKSATQTISLDSQRISDTVHLKVIKEKKKQLAGILTASQTIRLRPPASGTKAPTASGETVNIPAAKQTSDSTLKVNMPASASESGTIKISKPEISSSTGGTLKIKSPVPRASGTSGGTLKIKAAPAASGTIKVKAPVKGDETVKVGAPAAKKGGTLKLKAKSTVSSVPTQRTVKTPEETNDKAISEEKVDEVQKLTTEEGAEPGVIMTVFSLASLCAVGFFVLKTFGSYMELYK